jgi:sRNA-binding protein
MHYHEDQRREFIRYLAERFPKCFFVNSEMRRPLKKNILSDLEKLKVLDHDKLEQALTWYMNDFGYARKILTGAMRVDLNGKDVGAVTYPEHEDARKRMLARKKEMAERRELQQRNNELARRQAEMAATVVLKPAPPPQLPPSPPTNGADTDMTTQHTMLKRKDVLIEMARTMRPLTVTQLTDAALKKHKWSEPSLRNHIYHLIHKGELPQEWFITRAHFGVPLKSNGKTAEPSDGPATARPSNSDSSVEQLRARMDLFIMALSSSKPVAKQLATDVAKLVADEMTALVEAL